MSATRNTMSGKDWIGESRHAFCVGFALDMQAKRDEALATGDTKKAEQYESFGKGFLRETEVFLAWPPTAKQIVSDEEAVRLRAEEDAEKERQECADHLAAVRKHLEPRANSSAYRPYSGGLPTLGRRHR
ncbi:hypothetical protein [Streptomyces gardneri]|uniref:hypothetical protein n=1 Tax=Streptomyces gardneri TaxID=66892 RepID=UPI0035DA1241